MTIRTHKASILAATALLAGISSPTFAQDADQEAVSEQQTEILVTGSRLPADITSVPGTVTIVDEAELKLQSAISSDLGRILATTVPGFGPSAGDGNNFSQTLRGRKPSFFIDGAPQSAELRGGGRDLRILHPSVLERVEVINGATSIYGLGGSGGVVNYITKRPREPGVNWTTELSLSSPLSTIKKDGMEYSVTQTVTARVDRLDVVGSFNYQSRGLFYDAKGRRVAPDPYGQTGIADMTELSAFLRVGVDLTERVRWENTVLFYDAQVDTDYTVGQGSFARDVVSTAVPKRQNNICPVTGVCFDFIGVKDPRSYNLFGSSALTVEDVLGSTLQLRVYGKESEMIWRHIDFLAASPTSGGFPPAGSQLKTMDDRIGGRVDLNTPLDFGFLGGNVLWGVEANQNNIKEELVDGRDRTSKMTQTNLAAYAQVQAKLFDRLNVRTGVRFDDFKLEIPSFNALDFFSATKLHPVIGTDLKYNSVTGNFGVVLDVVRGVSVFASWSNGFSLGNVVRTISGLRPTSAAAPITTYRIANMGQIIEPVKVNSYEGGIRLNFDWFRASATLYQNRSKLGATFDPITLQVRRAPEKITGFELTGAVDIGKVATIGANYAKAKGELDNNNDGVWESKLDFTRVQPPLLNAYVDLHPLKSWTLRVQTSTIFDESRYPAPFSQLQRDIKGYTIVDMFLSGPVGPGTIGVGVENLLNKDYIPMATLLNCPSNVGLAGALFDSFCNTRATGARGTLRYTLRY